MLPNLSQKEHLFSLLKDFGIFPKHSLGQNFLLDEGVIDTMIHHADITPHHNVLEIGPGPGVLSQKLVQTPAKKLTLLELDEQFSPLLHILLAQKEHGELIIGDALQYSLPQEKTIIIANIPYYITSPLIRHYTQQQHPPEQILLLIQHEVAEKLCALPGDMNMLALETQLIARCEYICFVPKTSFYPSPKVDSAVVKITPQPQSFPHLQRIILSLASMAFSHKRKKIGNSLGKQTYKNRTILPILTSCNISLDTRPQSLSVEDWMRIATHFEDL